MGLLEGLLVTRGSSVQIQLCDNIFVNLIIQYVVHYHYTLSLNGQYYMQITVTYVVKLNMIYILTSDLSTC